MVVVPRPMKVGGFSTALLVFSFLISPLAQAAPWTDEILLQKFETAANRELIAQGQGQIVTGSLQIHPSNHLIRAGLIQALGDVFGEFYALFGHGQLWDNVIDFYTIDFLVWDATYPRCMSGEAQIRVVRLSEKSFALEYYNGTWSFVPSFFHPEYALQAVDNSKCNQ
ncbi:hypothetical protein K2X30_12405 [bacterium]|nr:hypothetical protein [bacterium]